MLKLRGCWSSPVTTGEKSRSYRLFKVCPRIQGNETSGNCSPNTAIRSRKKPTITCSTSYPPRRLARTHGCSDSISTIHWRSWKVVSGPLNYPAFLGGYDLEREIQIDASISGWFFDHSGWPVLVVG